MRPSAQIADAARTHAPPRHVDHLEPRRRRAGSENVTHTR